MAEATLVWFRLDLRLSDNPALVAALRRGGPVIPVYIWAPEEEGDWPPGAASRWWLHQSLGELGDSLRRRGSDLVIRSGSSLETLRALIGETRATAVYWNRRYEPASVARDGSVKDALRKSGVQAESFNSALLWEPWTIHTTGGGHYRVFTPYWRACLTNPMQPPPPRPAPERLPEVQNDLPGLPLPELHLEPAIDWAGGLRQAWKPGEVGAAAALERFMCESLEHYRDNREKPALQGVSRLSPHLHFGEISPRTVWWATRSFSDSGKGPSVRAAAEAYLRQLVWREFAHHLLFHCPESASYPLRPEFVRFPWRSSARDLEAWQQGLTGYPLVDAGMRELWTTGYMHNRVRMVAASFLTKHLLIRWQEGARWFWDTLLDADLANNTFGWQWTAGCGADAAPYFRIFNPVLQGERYDPQGEYVRRWVPELSGVDRRRTHRPWETTGGIPHGGGSGYPRPMVEHTAARKRALEAFQAL